MSLKGKTKERTKKEKVGGRVKITDRWMDRQTDKKREQRKHLLYKNMQ